MSLAVTPPRVAGPSAVAGGGARWVRHLNAVDVALETNDLQAALKAWQAAYGAALAGRHWEGYAAAADAYLRIARVASTPGAPRARDLYLSALFRARDAGSRDGVLRVAAAFDALGDREVAAQAQRIAHRLE
jgi:hypothetical protein